MIQKAEQSQTEVPNAVEDLAADIDTIEAVNDPEQSDRLQGIGDLGDSAATANTASEISDSAAKGIAQQRDPKTVVPSNTFLVIKELRSISRGRSLRLQTDDVIVAIDGQPFHRDIETFLDIMFECDQVSGVMLTIWRKGILFNVIVRGPLGCVIEHTKQDVSELVEKDFANFKLEPRENYTMYEVLRDIFRNCRVLDTRLSPTAFIFPPLWAMQHRLWEVLVATFLIYGATLAVHWVLFVIGYLVLSLYLRRAHLVLRRSFGLMRGRHIWLVIAAKSELEVQKLCRELDPKCVFTPDLVGPPVTDQPAKKRRRRRPARV